MKIKFFCRYLFVAILLTGCAISDRVSYEDGEGSIPREVFDDIKNGKTQKQWVVNQLGSPFAKAYGANNAELYTYRFSRAQTKHASLLLVLRYNGVERDVEYFHVVFDNDVVSKHWHDKFPVVQGFSDVAGADDVQAPMVDDSMIGAPMVDQQTPQDETPVVEM